jgi:hypothetical protein
MADARGLVNLIRGNIYKLRNESFSLSQEIYLIKQTEVWAKELMGMLSGEDKQHAKELFYDLEKYRLIYLKEGQTSDARELEKKRKIVLNTSIQHLAEIAA